MHLTRQIGYTASERFLTVNPADHLRQSVSRCAADIGEVAQVRALSKAARPAALKGLIAVCDAASQLQSTAGGATVARIATALLR